MRRRITIPLVATGAVVSALAVAAPVQAHGYVSGPLSRQALCAQGRVPDCGQIKYEPQSVEGPKGLRSCHAGIAQFAVLNDDSRGWPATSVGSSVTFTWTNTARHATSNWEYFIGGTRVAVVDGGGRQPGATVTHNVNLGSYSGRQKVLAVWNIADTANAFYSCVDLQVGGGGGPSPTPSPTPPAPSPTPTPTASPTNPPAPGGSWTAGRAYQAGDQATYGGLTYRCRQAHTAIPGWEPPNVPALWTQV
ncbi:lytic polysaccharide monooxygenase [Micromonospora peucetia]|uniref:Chitin-binding protein n=1 Tax=Micromonospora peucetia TaxID=47871 RepID=A0A1C6U196_9ACTN|nr:lytic polysaccharide monooxygenase [Micromonospora peucetia]MCX4385891.1 lytic polysaccharide monooxygenase [Micromonospora peucetia]WSA33268.1 lytic polysaccharide monooxygenase [Micromonospora peucetia]SCL47845.1 chitin-binding protein [Micromonospora peucetia]